MSLLLRSLGEGARIQLRRAPAHHTMIRAVERMRLGLVKKNAIRTDYRRAGMAAETCGSHGAKYQLVDPMDGSWVSGASNCILRRVPQPSECEGRDSPTAGVQGLCGLLCLVERERHDDCGVETKCSTSMKAGGDGGACIMEWTGKY